MKIITIYILCLEGEEMVLFSKLVCIAKYPNKLQKLTNYP